MTTQPLAGTEYTIRSVAKGYAEAFYEQKRSGKFRSMDSMVKAKTLKKLPDGTLVEVTEVVPFRTAYPNAHAYSVSHWPFFYDVARKSLVTMLTLSDVRVPPTMKEAIWKALREDRDKQLIMGGKHLIQVREEQVHG